MNCFAEKILLASLALSSVAAVAKAKEAPASQPALVSAPSSAKGPIAFGWKQHGIGDAATVGGFNVRYGLQDRLWVGGTLGLSADLDNIGLIAEARYDMNKFSDHTLYVEGALGFIKLASAKVIPINALFGFDMRLFEHVRATVGFGLQLGFKDVTNSFGLTGAPLTNLGLHWVL